MNRARWAYGSARVAAGVALAVAPFFSAPLREALVALEPVVAPVLFVAALVLAAADAVRPRRRAEILIARVLGRWGWAAAILLFLAPVWAHWALHPPGAAAAFGARGVFMPERRSAGMTGRNSRSSAQLRVTSCASFQ